ncbi:dynactin [Crassisporium funariophilum]|nr:dynactin [Crassisporium funariophilum]
MATKMDSSSPPLDPPLGMIVTTPQGRGVVRFKGTASFSLGKWYGVELFEQNGKNDGSVNGESYFTCEMGYGVFLRPSQISKVHGMELEAGPSKPPPTAARPLGAGHQRTPSASGLLRTNSIRSPPSSNASNASRSASPLKPVIALSVQPPALARSVSLKPPPPASYTKLTSTLSLQPRKSLIVRQSPAQDSPLSTSPISRNGTTSSAKQSSGAFGVKRTSSPLSLPPRQPSPPLNSLPVSHVVSSTVVPPHIEQELQELRAKIRVLEAKRADEARHADELQSRLSDAEAFVSIRPKLQLKLKELNEELISSRRNLADSQQLSQLAESRLIDAQDQLEIVMLDKEVAEERAELAEAELEEVKEKLAVMSVENDVLKEDQVDGEPGDNPAKDSLGYIQLEKQNQRLKEALIKLRDMTQETDQEQRRRISEMEKDVASIDKLEASYEEALIKLSNAETEIDGLKLQLDDALAAEDMLVRLTERNLMLGEKIEEMRITIEDLEALKELSDELEENHTETEKQLHEDLDAKDAQLRDHVLKIGVLEETCQDFENTINQFRELVMQLQSELDQLRTQTQTAQTESASAASQSAAMMSLNLKLQSSAMKNLARNIQLELTTLEAREARELFKIAQPYLPQMYYEADLDATQCYMAFQRLAFKADLINTVVAQVHNLPDALNGDVSEVIIGVCEMRGRMSGISTLSKRFAAILRTCDVETFLSVARIYPDLKPLENGLNNHIKLLQTDELNVEQCVSDITRIQRALDEMAVSYFDGFESDLLEREMGYVLAFDHDLDMFAALIGFAKTSVADIMKEDDIVVDMGGYDIEQVLFEPMVKLLGRCKSAKMLAKKLIKQLEELSKKSSALKPHLIAQLTALSNYAPQLSNFGVSLAGQIVSHIKEIRPSKSALQLVTILKLVKESATSTLAKDLKTGSSPWEAVGDAITHLIEEGNKLFPTVTEAENIITVSGTAPWIARIQEIKAALAVNVEAERKVAQLNDEIQALARNVKTKDQTVQESAVKIELMERRLEAIKKQADTIAELEKDLAAAKKQEKASSDTLLQLHSELDNVYQENAKLKASTAGQERQTTGAQPAEPEHLPIEGNLETSHLLEQIDALRGTVRFLRMENSYLKGHDLLREIEALPPLPQRVLRAPTPPLMPSGNSDTEDSDSDELPAPPTLFSLSTETKKLYRDVMKYSSAPRVVDLSALNAKRAEAKGGKVWMPRKQSPAHQVLERKMEGERLSRRVHGLLERASAIGANL